ncbi:hypothetical protein [Kribbella sp. CA-294648]|uniref:hypothetical protein n=1 Tax=Kribbella sp. CA-294648 TaxID=3239948 RepID=UPI003D9178FC
MIDLQTLLQRRNVTPAEVEAALLDDYSAFVRLAYLILPPSLGRHRRILAAHGVVQRAYPTVAGCSGCWSARPTRSPSSAAESSRTPSNKPVPVLRCACSRRSGGSGCSPARAQPTTWRSTRC